MGQYNVYFQQKIVILSYMYWYDIHPKNGISVRVSIRAWIASRIVLRFVSTVLSVGSYPRFLVPDFVPLSSILEDKDWGFTAGEHEGLSAD